MSGLAGLDLCLNALNENHQQCLESISGRSLLKKYLDVADIKLQKLFNQLSSLTLYQQSQQQQEGMICYEFNAFTSLLFTYQFIYFKS